MLLNEQAAELLKRCEEIVGTELSQVRGNLSKAESRASAVWELLVLEAASKIGPIEYEPHPGGSPDIQLFLPGYRPVWIEVAFLYPRFWKEERKLIAVTNWIFSEAKRREIPSFKIHPSFDGINKNNAGPVLKLPELNERKIFLNSNEIKYFFDSILSEPNLQHLMDSINYTISISYSPNAQGPYNISSSLVQEVPTSVEEHAVYRVLKEKAKQHDVCGPHIICIGSDQSRAVSRTNTPGEVRFEDAIRRILAKNLSLSAVIVVSIENNYVVLGKMKKQAKSEIFINPHSNTPLSPEEIELLSKLDFNKWKYSFPLVNWKNEGSENFRSVTGTLTLRANSMGIEVEIPANIVVDALAGKITLAKAYDLKEDDPIYRAVNEGWNIETCSYKNGNIEMGEAPKIVIQLSPPLKVYKKNTKNAYHLEGPRLSTNKSIRER